MKDTFEMIPEIKIPLFIASSTGSAAFLEFNSFASIFEVCP